MALEDGTAEAPAFDMDAAVDTIGAGLGFGEDDAGDDTLDAGGGDDTVDSGAGDDTLQSGAADDTAAAATPRAPPKSWAKEKHDIWAKMPVEAQEYYEQREKQMLDGLEQYKGDSGFGKQIREAVSPFENMLKSQNVDAPKAVSYLLAAHQRLSFGTMESRRSAYEELGRNLGLAAADPNAAQIDPTVKALQDKVASIEGTLTASQQATLNAAKTKTAHEVETFAADTAHQYFDEVADDILPFLNAGLPLKEAYDKAIWANPVTRAKEQARIQTETEKKLRENARLDALKGRKAASTNVRTRDTNRAPTEPLGSMEDTMKDTLREIKARVH